jgi:putative transposase
MRITSPQTGQSYVGKRRRRYAEPGQPRELTFSCYRRFPFLGRERTRQWFREALEVAREKSGFHVWAYVLMPEHVHLLVYLGQRPEQMGRFLQYLKEPIARKAVAYLKENAPEWQERLKVREGLRQRHRFWQPGGGYDRNITTPWGLRSVIDYIHANPVRRGLAAKAEDWEWSSARWHAGLRPVKIEIDDTITMELARDGVFAQMTKRSEIGEIKC